MTSPSQTNGDIPTTTTSSAPAVQPPEQPSQNPPPQSASDLPPAALDLAAKLFDLARNGDTQTLTAYITAGIPPNLTNSAGDTLLILSSYHGHSSTAKALLEAGADSNVLNGRGQSAIAGAVFKGHDEVVKVLFEGGADIRAGQPSAVDCARMFKKEGLLELFGVDQGEGTEMQVNGGGQSREAQEAERREAQIQEAIRLRRAMGLPDPTT